MGGRGASSGLLGKGLSPTERASLTKGIKSHTKEENDKAESRLERNLHKELEVVKNAQTYISLGKIKDTNDQWFQEHVRSAKELSAQLKFFRQQRKRLNK